MVTSVCGVGVQDGTAGSARKLMYSQVCICFLLLLTVTVPNVLWQMVVAGGVRHDDIAKTAIDDLLQNSSVIQSIPALKDVNLTKYKAEFLDAASSVNKDQTTIALIGGCLFVLIFPFFCLCYARHAIANNSSLGMTCICCVEGLVGWMRLLTWLLPLAIAAAVVMHLKDNQDFLKCEDILPWVQKAVSDAAVGAVKQQQPPHNVSTALLALSAPHATVTGVIKEIFTVGNVTAPFKTSFLDAVSAHMNTTTVDALTQSWLVEVKSTLPGIQPLAAVTGNFFSYMFDNTKAEQTAYCTKGLAGFYKVAGLVGTILCVLAAVACCEVFTCCFGSCEAWGAKNTLGAPGGLFVGVPVAVEEQKPLMSREADKPVGSAGPPPLEKGGLSCCATASAPKCAIQ